MLLPPDIRDQLIELGTVATLARHCDDQVAYRAVIDEIDELTELAKQARPDD